MSALSKFETPEPAEEEHRQHRRNPASQDGDRLRRGRPGATPIRNTWPCCAGFAVEPDLPPALRVGCSAEPAASTPGCVFPTPAARRSPTPSDVRGCAIKLREVPGQRIAESDEPATQDFLMVSMPTMPLGTVQAVPRRDLSGHRMVAAAVRGQDAADRPRAACSRHCGREDPPHLAGGHPLLEHHALSLRRRSGGEVLAGADLVHRSTPAGDAVRPLPQRQPAAAPGRGDASFDFKVQLRTQRRACRSKTPPSNGREDQSPFVKVATLRMPKQEFRTPSATSCRSASLFLRRMRGWTTARSAR